MLTTEAVESIRDLVQKSIHEGRRWQLENLKVQLKGILVLWEPIDGSRTGENSDYWLISDEFNRIEDYLIESDDKLEASKSQEESNERVSRACKNLQDNPVDLHPGIQDMDRIEREFMGQFDPIH